ncbi:hypothetical protein TCDM_05292 [Trypanosoma cruzi Dm28c]|uniref:Uncharacterized protein n=1 Tax=Trypanosoma cruzi Dm28c TaxID=1416333 RepID=V5BJ69_TRYCR|nr:hypothetical protein TCDM_05292 [Trypanosoma cruzi Dm28c]
MGVKKLQQKNSVLGCGIINWVFVPICGSNEMCILWHPFIIIIIIIIICVCACSFILFYFSSPLTFLFCWNV